MNKKKYLLLLIPVILIAAFIIVNYKPLSLAVEYYNETNVYSLENYTASLNYFIPKVGSDVANNNYKQYMLDVTDYYITSDFVYIIFDRLGLLEPYINGIRSKLIRQFLFIVIITYKFTSHYNLKVAEMLKYYPIKDIGNFPELTLSFMTKISNYALNPYISKSLSDFIKRYDIPILNIPYVLKKQSNLEKYKKSWNMSSKYYQIFMGCQI